jgi:hypothetical protein
MTQFGMSSGVGAAPADPGGEHGRSGWQIEMGDGQCGFLVQSSADLLPRVGARRQREPCRWP